MTKRDLKWTAATLGCMAVLAVIIAVPHGASTQIALSTESPARLKIPSLQINAEIESVGYKTEGEMDVPKNILNVAWFNLGPRPGEKGTAVIDGHYGWKNKIPAAFDSLIHIQIGDQVIVENEKGVAATFIVKEIRHYRSSDNAARAFVSRDGLSHLNLITCSGGWNIVTKNYNDRVVVFTDKISA